MPHAAHALRQAPPQGRAGALAKQPVKIPDLPLKDVLELWAEEAEEFNRLVILKVVDPRTPVPFALIRNLLRKNLCLDGAMAHWGSANITALDFELDRLAEALERRSKRFDRTCLGEALGIYPYRRVLDTRFSCFNGTWLLRADLQIGGDGELFCLGCQTWITEAQKVEYDGWHGRYCPNCHPAEAEDDADEITPTQAYEVLVLRDDPKRALAWFELLGERVETIGQWQKAAARVIARLGLRIEKVEKERDLDAEFMVKNRIGRGVFAVSGATGMMAKLS